MGETKLGRIGKKEEELLNGVKKPKLHLPFVIGHKMKCDTHKTLLNAEAIIRLN